jgi:tRNA pseudouridine38-40 synthase
MSDPSAPPNAEAAEAPLPEPRAAPPAQPHEDSAVLPARRNIRLILAYDGTDFCGWQVQNKDRTVQGALMEALERMHGHPVRVTAAGRTDSGVHATGQVANFYTEISSIPGERFTDALNAYLPKDVRVLSSHETGPRFHARRSARLRVYRYYILSAPVCPPHLRNYCHWTRRHLDINRLNAMASLLEGEHDFTSFSARGDKNKSKVRQVAASVFHREGMFLVYTIAASSFLWKMVRTVIGTFLALDEDGHGAEELRRILESRSRFEARETAPARGLFLERVEYGPE